MIRQWVSANYFQFRQLYINQLEAEVTLQFLKVNVLFQVDSEVHNV